ncbi:GtrA family protein [Micromonospora sp. WMMA2032]|uniref:Putative flippase GtrA (Transmembrane translocase of bactoprenol-linked glucose) n=1 Tax=Micromonospora sediminicola TaxID=946078 RepID=A0A1A9BGY0_9ACTN|nr:MULTISPECIES: GtrA family protein [Micromonospora]ATO15019.1 GtrA family protein [Micromonospora sp. WMMA2032]PGH43470.1 GtrA family protein [Micromonospora sp. WMMA1996]SBT68775.1 Putative flippase GtrA (transmembrane translocase of bactoprenol-linked glucose) [Micromonospora sediminicola]
MPGVRLLPERWQKFIHEALKFGIVGGINTVINYAVFNALALTVFRDGQLKATVIATIVATITSYLMNRHWTYRDRPKSALRREYALFFLFNGAGLLIELGVLALAKYGLGVHGLLALNVAKTIGVLLATLFRFWSYRTFVFQPVPKHAEETWHSVPRDEWDNVAEMDPVAELAESVSELEEEEPPLGAGGRAVADYSPPQGRTAPADAGLGGALGADLDAELAAELQPRRARR